MGLCFLSCLPCREEQRSSVCRNLVPSPCSPATRKLLSKQEDAEPRWHPLPFGAGGPTASSCISGCLSSVLFSRLFSSFVPQEAWPWAWDHKSIEHSLLLVGCMVHVPWLPPASLQSQTQEHLCKGISMPLPSRNNHHPPCCIRVLASYFLFL